jgi:hypothetical protein
MTELLCLGATSLVACESASEADVCPVKRQRALASCLSLWRQFFSYGEILVENITPLMADIRSVMANIESPMATIKRPMANIRSLMANIEILMAKITSRYGEKYSGMAKNSLGSITYGGNYPKSRTEKEAE